MTFAIIEDAGLLDTSSARPGPICGVFAVALAAGVPTDQAYTVMAAYRKCPARWKGRTHRKDRMKALAHFGVRTKAAYAPPETVQRFAATRARPGVHYMIEVAGHIMTLKDGVLMDQNQVEHVTGHKRKRCIVKAVFECERGLTQG